MGRHRATSLGEPVERGKHWVISFRHPLRDNQVVRFKLGPVQSEAQRKVRELNKVFPYPERWHNPPGDMDPNVREMWLGNRAGVSTEDKSVKRDGKPRKVTKGALAAALTRAEGFERMANHWHQQYLALKKKYERELGKRHREGPAVELQKAFTVWTENYKGRDADHTETVKSSLRMFVRKFGETMPLDEFDHNEQKIKDWLWSLKRKRVIFCEGKKEVVHVPISPSRRNQIRMQVLRFLADNGVALDRKLIPAAGVKAVRAHRGAVRWLQDDQARALARALEWSVPLSYNKYTSKRFREAPADPLYWADLFRVQVGLGLRPSELITLKRGDFQSEHGRRTLTLSALGTLTLKTGSRKIPVSDSVWKIVERRLKDEKVQVLFPDPRTGKPWKTEESFSKAFRLQIKHALDRVNAEPGGVRITFKVDARIGRRTFASRLINQGVTVEDIAEMMGDDPETVREHYGALMPSRLDASKAAL